VAGPDLGYDVGGLRTGGTTAGTAGTEAAAAATVLGGVVCPPGTVFGQVAGAELLAAALGRARDAHARTGAQVADQHDRLQGRAGATAGHGDGLTTATTAIAQGMAG
jgi:hypothetical protein